jgi:hypothetical protein
MPLSVGLRTAADVADADAAVAMGGVRELTDNKRERQRFLL